MRVQSDSFIPQGFDAFCVARLLRTQSRSSIVPVQSGAATFAMVRSLRWRA